MNQQTSHRIARARDSLDAFTRRAKDFGPLLIRLTVGVMFAQAGWGKLQHLERTIGYFESLGIVAADIQAPLVANVEFVGGLLLIAGLATRLVALPLATTMVVAILTAKIGDVEGITDLLALDESIYFAALLLLVSQGPGRWSLDRLIERQTNCRVERDEDTQNEPSYA